MLFSEMRAAFLGLRFCSSRVESKLCGLPLPLCRSSVLSVAKAWFSFPVASNQPSRMITLLAIAAFTLATAAVAVSLRNLIHSALLLIASWSGIALFYLWAGAEFVAFAQVLVYVGAISMVVLFAVLLTRQSRVDPPAVPATTRRASAAVIVGIALFGVLATAISRSSFAAAPAADAPALTVLQLGNQMMDSHAAAVLIVGVVLTVSLLGAIVLAASDIPKKGDAP